MIWLGGVAQADSASSTLTAPILLKLDLPIGAGLGRKHKRNLAAFLNGSSVALAGKARINIPTVSVVFVAITFQKCRLD
ncbi:hypothetical protein [Mesorhizobium tianshanense]|uniref:hypothetical protein n=1 Tax=Mesorhizobium tianshanense TaxID=39844 RepID=UPI001391B49D|nr:hypothetical protein [Mesorhizobium tianshanense]